MLRVPSSYSTIIDFGVKSGKEVGYVTYFVDSDAYTTPTESEERICISSKSYYLYECTADETSDNVYHVLNIFRFGNNIESGSVSNNNAPTWLENFTKYPVRQPSAQMPKSGVLSALLSNTTEYGYADTAEQMDRLYNISASRNTFFLKDRKGNLYMVGIDGAVSQQINDASAVQEVSVSIPWREIGDAEKSVLIQLPTDEGWGKDEENAGKDFAEVISAVAVNIRENGTTEVLPPSGSKAISKVTINTNVSSVEIVEMTFDEYSQITPDPNTYYALRKE